MTKEDLMKKAYAAGWEMGEMADQYIRLGAERARLDALADATNDLIAEGHKTLASIEAELQATIGRKL